MYISLMCVVSVAVQQEEMIAYQVHKYILVRRTKYRSLFSRKSRNDLHTVGDGSNDAIHSLDAFAHPVLYRDDRNGSHLFQNRVAPAVSHRNGAFREFRSSRGVFHLGRRRTGEKRKRTILVVGTVQ